MSNRYYIYDAYTDQVAEFGVKEVFSKAAKRVGSMGKAAGKQASLRGQQALGLATSAPGLAAIGAGAIGGGAYMGKKAYDKRKKERGSIKNRIRKLIGR